MATTGYNAGIDTSDVVVSYAKESNWAEVPAVAFQEIRLTGEGFSEQKGRSRPQEIRATGDAAHAVTTNQEASGSLSFALSAGTYDDFFEGLVNGTWSTPLAIQSVATTGIITAYDGGTTALPNLGGAGFTFGDDQGDDIVAGQWIKVSGFGSATDGFYRVTEVDAANDEVQVSSTAGNGANIVDQDASSGTEVTITGSYVRNATDVTTFYVQKQFASNLFLTYAGSYITGGSVSAQVGDFLNGSFEFISESESKQTSDQSTGPASAAPSGRVIDSVSGVNELALDDTAPSGIIQGIDFSVTKENARQQFGIGSASAQGLARGTLTVSGTMSTYFLDFSLYDEYKAETDKIVSFRATDNLGNGYIFTFPAVTLMNPSIVAGGPDSDVMAEFELEGNPASGGVYDGVTIQIDKFPPA